LLPALLLFLHSPFLFGYAKPVPINFRALHNPRRDMVLVAAAGSSMNILLALLAAVMFYLTYLTLLRDGLLKTCEMR
jgi:Zn-dependent protease